MNIILHAVLCCVVQGDVSAGLPGQGQPGVPGRQGAPRGQLQCAAVGAAVPDTRHAQGLPHCRPSPTCHPPRTPHQGRQLPRKTSEHQY